MSDPAPPAPEPRVSTFRHDGAQLVVEETGDGTRTFLLVHGIGMGRRVFGELVAQLAPYGRVVAVDLPGYGDAAEPARIPTIERLADLLAAYLRAHDAPGETIAIGHSMGTQVVTELASRHPGRVDRIVLVAPTVDPAARTALGQLARLGHDLLIESPRCCSSAPVSTCAPGRTCVARCGPCSSTAPSTPIRTCECRRW